MKQPTTKFELLSSFRGIAALLIATFHFPVIFLGAQSPIVRNAYVLTNLFFALSGFLFFQVYKNRLETFEQFKTFAKNRFFRLYPLHVLATGLVLLTPIVAYLSLLLFTYLFKGEYAGGFAYPNQPLNQIIGDLFLLQGFGLFDSLHLNFPAWSMGALFFCSVLFGFILYLRLPVIPTFGVIVVAAFGILVFNSYSYMGSSYDYGIFRCAVSFFSGALIWHLWNNDEIKKVLTEWALVFQTIMLIVALTFLTVVGINSLKSMASPFVWGLFILAFSVDKTDYGVYLTSPVFKWLSDRSYSMFLNHACLLFIGIQTNDWLVAFGAPEAIRILGGTVSLFVYLGAVIALSDWTYRNVELKAVAYFNPKKLVLPPKHQPVEQ